MNVENFVEKTDTSVEETIENMIVECIYNAVMEQRLAPKTKLSEVSLCRTFDVGRMHVRRALLLLSSHGIIDLHSNKGAYIACPDKAQANEVFDARMLIEPPLVRQLAERATSKELKILADHIDLEDAARAGQNRSELIRLSGEFHTKLAEAGQNSLIVKMMRELVTKTSLIVGLFGRPRSTSCPDDEHSKILKAIQSGNAIVAESLVKEHLHHIRESLNMEIVTQPANDLEKILRGEA